MICPVCSNLMIVLELNNVEIDYCPACGGIWLDSGELELLLNNSQAKTELINSLQKAKGIKENLYRCPICFKKMIKVYSGNGNKVLIDKCTRNHGLWFDKGELENVVKYGSLDSENKTLCLLKEMFNYNLSLTKPEE